MASGSTISILSEGVMNIKLAAQAGQGGPVTVACVNKAKTPLGYNFDKLTAHAR